MIRRILEKAGSPSGAPLAATLAYVVIAGLAILLTGAFVGLRVDDPILMTRIVLLKEGVFVAVTAACLYLLLRRGASLMQRSREVSAASRDFHLPVFEGLRIPVWRSDPGGRWDFVNRSWLAMTGREEREELGRGWQTGIAEEDREEFVRRYIAAVAARRPFALECRLRTEGGGTRWITHYGSPFYDLDGVFAGHLGFCRDVTDRRAREAEEHRARTLASIGTLAGRIAHDFNNLLTAILGNISLAKLLAGQGRGGEILPRLDEAEGACARAQTVARELLTFSEGGTPLRRPASLPEIIRKAAADVCGTDPDECSVRLRDDLLPVEIDEGQIRQVIENVVQNAREASPDGGRVTVAAENVAVREEDPLPLRAGNYVCITVSDRGVGIREEDLPKIFDPFFTTKEKGTGLGLSITYSIVKRHEGYVTARSRTGDGTTFRIYLPSSAPVPPAPTDRSAEKEGGAPHRILLLEDEVLVRDVVRRMLAQLGYDVTPVGDGNEAVAACRSARDEGKPYSAVILDLTIPGGRGGEACLRDIRDIVPGVRAVVSSGYVNDPVMKDPVRFGFRAAIPKPYDIDGIRAALSAVLNER